MEGFFPGAWVKRFFFLVCSLYLAAGPGSSRAGAAERRAGENLTLKIAVMGPGDELYFWWGHIALVIEDPVMDRTRFYDYGLFSFDNENFFFNFAFGRLLYSCGASPAEFNYLSYLSANRDITLYTLDIPPAKREEVRRFAEWNILPENRDYYYHHFRDNCASRIRDILDLATDGQFWERFGQAPGRFTLRQHVRRHTWFSPFMDWLLNFLMGPNIDRPLTVWEEMFLPSEIGRRIEDLVYTGPDGRERNLVSSVEILNRAAGRPPVLEKPRLQWPRELLAGFFFFAMLTAFWVVRERGFAAGRILWGLGQGLAGLFFGITGTLLFFMSFFTNHDYTYRNINLLFANPLLLAALPLGILWIRARDQDRRRTLDRALQILWTQAAVLCLLSQGLRVFPSFYQQNQVDAALFFPIALSLSFASLLTGEFFRRVFWRWFD
jgi:hypothetical protein